MYLLLRTFKAYRFMDGSLKQWETGIKL